MVARAEIVFKKSGVLVGWWEAYRTDYPEILGTGPTHEAAKADLVQMLKKRVKERKPGY